MLQIILKLVNFIDLNQQSDIGRVIYNKGWRRRFASKFKCVLKICFSSVSPEILKVWEQVCQLYSPEKKSVKSYVVLLPGNGNDHLVDRDFVPQTFFQKISQVVCRSDELLLLIPKPFIFWKTNVPDSRNLQKTSKNLIKILIFWKRPKPVFFR